jgi:hypothetical protein
MVLLLEEGVGVDLGMRGILTVEGQERPKVLCAAMNKFIRFSHMEGAHHLQNTGNWKGHGNIA